MSALEDRLFMQIKALNLPEPTREYRFAAMSCGGIGKGVRDRLRKANLKDWKSDFCWIDHKIICEVEGGIWVKGRHTRGKGFQADLIKYQEAMLLGYIIYRCSGEMIKDGSAVKSIHRLLSIR